MKIIVAILSVVLFQMVIYCDSIKTSDIAEIKNIALQFTKSFHIDENIKINDLKVELSYYKDLYDYENDLEGVKCYKISWGAGFYYLSYPDKYLIKYISSQSSCEGNNSPTEVAKEKLENDYKTDLLNILPEDNKKYANSFFIEKSESGWRFGWTLKVGNYIYQGKGNYVITDKAGKFKIITQDIITIVDELEKLSSKTYPDKDIEDIKNKVSYDLKNKYQLSRFNIQHCEIVIKDEIRNNPHKEVHPILICDILLDATDDEKKYEISYNVKMDDKEIIESQILYESAIKKQQDIEIVNKDKMYVDQEYFVDFILKSRGLNEEEIKKYKKSNPDYLIEFRDAWENVKNGLKKIEGK